jgi:RNA polymerase sigma factor (sigma-70 family)
MNAAFPETTFGLVCRMRKTEPAQVRAALETLCQRYWAPVASYARAAWARDDHDAQDLAQEFFAWLLEADVLQRYAPERGSFRNFLKGVLRNFERNQAQARRRLKRGGGARAVSLDDTQAPLHESVPSSREGDPAAAFDAAFDKAWLAELTSRAVARLKERYSGDKRAVRFRVFEAYDLAPEGERPTYGELASRLGLKESDVRNHLFSVREALRDELRAELCDTVADRAALEEEWKALVGA